MKSLLENYIKVLKENNQLIIIDEEIDPDLEMASAHLHHFKHGNKAVFFKNVKRTRYSALSNLFGSIERSKLIFGDSLDDVKKIIQLKNDPRIILKNPINTLRLLLKSRLLFPKKVSFPKSFKEIKIQDLPLIKCWPKDGGAFITLPQVYSEDIDSPGVMNSNLGMYRIQLNGNEYVLNKEIGLHYQIHRGIGVHQQKSNMKKQPLKVSIFIGGHPAHTLSAVMPLPEGISELSFAGLLSGKRFRYAIRDGFTISADADFVICGEVMPEEVKPEGPFGDHLGYYSLKHDFPVLRVSKVYAKDNGIWPFTVVGRPPQEDSQFGALIHSITKEAIQKEIPGLIALNAVDASGVHPLLLAIGSERYTPYDPKEYPQEILTIANHILGKGQLSLAKFLFICDNNNAPDVNNEREYFTYFFERVNWERDLHFQTKTTIDTLDYSGDGLNEGSKVVIAAAGKIKRNLITDLQIKLPSEFSMFRFVSKGNIVIQGKGEIKDLVKCLEEQDLKGIALITVVDDAEFVSGNFSNWLWVTFTRSNPASDIYGLNETIKNKHFSCSIPVIDARIKEHHAPVLER